MAPSTTSNNYLQQRKRLEQRAQDSKANNAPAPRAPLAKCTHKFCLVEQHHLDKPYTPFDNDLPKHIRNLEDKVALSQDEKEEIEMFYSIHRARGATIPPLNEPECTSAFCSARIFEPHAARPFASSDAGRPKEVKAQEKKIRDAQIYGADTQGWWQNTSLDVFYSIHAVQKARDKDKDKANADTAKENAIKDGSSKGKGKGKENGTGKTYAMVAK